MEVPFNMQKQQKPLQRPKTLVCYICGREYGTKSLPIHLKTCKQKWEVEQMKLPPKQRRPLPQAPESFDELLKGGINTKKLEVYNDQAYNKWDQEALIACPHCERTFLPDRLEIHLRSCKADKPLKPRIVSVKGQNSTNEVKNPERSIPARDQIQPYRQQQQPLGEVGGSSGGTRGETHQISSAFMKNMQNPNMMFTLDEEDDETEYGESFKSSIKSNVNSKIKYVHRIHSHSSDEEEDDDDIDPDQGDRFAYRQDIRKGEFSDEQTIYQITAKDMAKEQQIQVKSGKPIEQQNKRKVENIQINIQKPSESNYQATTAKQVNTIDSRYQCHYCERKFAKDRIDVHEEKCKKLASKQRPTFDPSKQRLGDIKDEIEPQKQSSKKKQEEKPVKQAQPQEDKDDKKKKWKQQHEQLLQAIRISKKMKELEDNGGSTQEIQQLAKQIPQQNTEDLVPCPYCQRRFNPTVAERHIPKCKDTVNKPKPPPRLRNLLEEDKHEDKHEERISVANKNQSQTRPKTATSYSSGGGGTKISQTSFTANNNASPNPSQKVPVKSILKKKNETSLNNLSINKCDSSTDSKQSLNQPPREEEVSIGQKIIDIFKNPGSILRSKQKPINNDSIEFEDPPQAKNYDLPLQSPTKGSTFSPPSKVFSPTMSSEDRLQSTRSSQVVEEKHANYAQSSPVKKMRKTSCYDHPDSSNTTYQTRNSTINPAPEEKKKVHFVRSHTPKPTKSKAINHNIDDDNSKCLSPMRGPSISHHEQPKNPSALKSQFNHGDVFTRSSMYSNVQCPYCHRMFSESASQRHIPICATIIARPKMLDEKQLSNQSLSIPVIGHSQFGLNSGVSTSQQFHANQLGQSRQKSKNLQAHTFYNESSNGNKSSRLISTSFDKGSNQNNLMSPKSVNPMLANNYQADLGSTNSIDVSLKQDPPPHQKAVVTQATISNQGTPAPKFCTGCGWQHRDIDKFCGGCGQKRF